MKKLVVTLCLILILCMAILPIKVYAESKITIDPNDYKPDPIPDEDKTELTNKAGIIVGVLKTVGIVVMVITLMVLGIKYMTGSIEEKADYKKSMIPYLIGATLLFAITQVLGIIISFTEDL